MLLGGIIGQILFLIYINHVATEIDMHSNIFLFADDTKSLVNLVMFYSYNKIKWSAGYNELSPN